MQFYLIFPFIPMIQAKLPYNIFRLFLIGSFLTSLIYQHTRKNRIDYYENTISRLWQFLVGIVAAQQSFKVHKYICRFLFVIASALIFYPISLSQGLASFITVVIVAVVISFSSSKYSPFDFLPFYSGMVYLGDISYALYLIHWPLITYMKYCTINAMLSPFGKNFFNLKMSFYY